MVSELKISTDTSPVDPRLIPIHVTCFSETMNSDGGMICDDDPPTNATFVTADEESSDGAKIFGFTPVRPNVDPVYNNVLPFAQPTAI